MDSKQIEKFLRQEQEREQQEEFLATARAEMHKKGASERSIRIALTGLHEYMQATAVAPEPAPPGSPSNFKQPTVAGGFFLSNIASRPVEWLWQGRIPMAALTLLEGDPGIGKSLLTLDLAACVSSGQPMPDATPGREGTVILIAPHDSTSHTIKPRLEAAGGDPSRVYLLNIVEDINPKNAQFFTRPFSLSEDLHLLEKLITRLKAVLVIIDTLDICQPHQRHRALPRLVDLAERTGCAIVLTRPRTTSRPGQDAPIHSTAPSTCAPSSAAACSSPPTPETTSSATSSPPGTRSPRDPKPSTMNSSGLLTASPPSTGWEPKSTPIARRPRNLPVSLASSAS